MLSIRSGCAAVFGCVFAIGFDIRILVWARFTNKSTTGCEYLDNRGLPQLPWRLVKVSYQSDSAIQNVELTGYLDGLLSLDAGGYAIIDIKTTDRPEYVRAITFATECLCLLPKLSSSVE